jgi:cell division protein ZapE
MSCSVARPLDSVTVSSSSTAVSGIGRLPEAAPLSLCAREPHVPADRLVAEMVPPPRFDSVRFSTYIPDPNQPSQSEAVRVLDGFATGLGGAHATGSGRRRWFSRKPERLPAGPRGVYLDGGYGVGKTHLLASLWHATPAEPALKAFGTFVELTNLVGALGFQKTVQTLSGHRLLCIDEFELDDPGDTMMMTRLLDQLVSTGTRVAATSNTPPNSLGEGRFAASDFLREIHAMSANFEAVRIDGLDYRRRNLQGHAVSVDPDHLDHMVGVLLERGSTVTVDDFGTLISHLATVHPSKYIKMIEGIDVIVMRDAFLLTNQTDALRLVAFIDRVYDAEIPILASGLPLDEVFDEEMMAGGYRKKYLRSKSRMIALTTGELPPHAD